MSFVVNAKSLISKSASIFLLLSTRNNINASAFSSLSSRPVRTDITNRRSSRSRSRSHRSSNNKRGTSSCNTNSRRTIINMATTNNDNDDDDNNKIDSDLPRIDGSELVGSTRWLKLETLSYTDIKGKERKWDYATRTTKKSKSSTDAVVIIPLLKRPYAAKADDDDDEEETTSTTSIFDTLLVEQYRPPVGQSTMEFPAGLIDDGETPEQAALRELREETGYVGEACKTPPIVSKQVCMSPGLCDETVQCVVVMVDLDNPYNNPDGALWQGANPDEGEHIKVHRVSLNDGFQTLLDKGSTPMAIQGLYLFAMGLEIGKSMK